MKTLISVVALTTAVASAAYGQGIEELDKAACESRGGRQACVMAGIAGDGKPYNVETKAPSPTAAFLGGFARTSRQGVDNGYPWTCTMNPQRPVMPENRLESRCRGEAEDMFVGACTNTDGKLSCQYVNTVHTRSQTLELCGCWK